MSAVEETPAHARTTKSAFGSHILAKRRHYKKNPQALITLISSTLVGVLGGGVWSMIAAGFPPNVQQVQKLPSTNQLQPEAARWRIPAGWRFIPVTPVAVQSPSKPGHERYWRKWASIRTGRLLIRQKKKQGHFLGCTNVGRNQT